MISHRRHLNGTVRALALCVIAGYLVFATTVATCVDHQAGAHHHAGPTANHHPLCGETQCSGAGLVADGQSALTAPPTCSGSVAPSVVALIAAPGLLFTASRAPPRLLA